MIALHTPRGLPVNVPETDAEDPSPKFRVNELRAAREYYADNGYCVIRGAIDPQACEELKSLWASEIKPSRSFIYRQATAKAERHHKNANGWVMNPILNIQSMDPREFAEFRRFGTEEILTAPRMIEALRTLLDEDPIVVQSMYFEGNSATWEHQDTYYLDSEQIGAMTAGWIALEDIVATAGRFFVCAGSHKVDMGLQTLANNIADHHEEYIQSVVSKIKTLGLEIRAPKLNKGDVLLWNARTMHGSLAGEDPTHTRQSVTLHAIPASHRFLQLQNRIVPLRIRRVNGVKVHHPKDLERAMPRLIKAIETTFPSAFYAAKKLAVKSMVAARAGAGD